MYKRKDKKNVAQRAWYHKNKQIMWNRALERKKEVLAHYSTFNYPCCSHCGIDDIDVLCLDHISNNGNKQRRQLNISGNSFYYWLQLHNYPTGFQTLCFNCNMKKSMENTRRLREELNGWSI